MPNRVKSRQVTTLAGKPSISTVTDHHVSSKQTTEQLSTSLIWLMKAGANKYYLQVWLRYAAAHPCACAAAQRMGCFSLVRCWVKRGCMIIRDEAVGLHFTTNVAHVGRQPRWSSKSPCAHHLQYLPHHTEHKVAAHK
eukprot:364743-Chlamydomonas_euryale.AAC.103